MGTPSKPKAAMTLAKSVLRTFNLAGFPLSAWLFALRIWIAMMMALYAAFWLQLESASSAAVTVGILALQTRGQSYQKAVYRILATVVGVAASLVIAASFAQSRELFLVGFAGWLGLCVYIAGLLDGNRAYGAVLAGYTVAVVAMTQIDAPQTIFLAGINRGAAIVIGVVAVALVSDVLAAPNVHSALSDKLKAAHRRVGHFAIATLGGESADPIESANLLREITGLRPDITALAAESSRGGARGAAARSAAVALVAEVSAVGALASLPPKTLPCLRKALGEALACPLRERSRALQDRLQGLVDVGYADLPGALFARHALDLLIQNSRAQDAIEDVLADRHPARAIHAPIYRSRRAALRHGLRAFLAVLISAMLFSLSGWPFLSWGVALVAALTALSATVPNARAFGVNAVIAMPIAALLAGVTEFMLLDGVDQFPLLAIGMAPTVLGSALLLTCSNQQLASIAFLVLVFFVVILSPADPQAYNPETYLFLSIIAIASAILLRVLLGTVLPTSDELRRHWYLTSAQSEVHNLLVGGRSPRPDDEALFRDADRIGQLAALQPPSNDNRRGDLRQAVYIFGCAAAVRQVRTKLAELSARSGGLLVGDAYSALSGCEPRGLRQAAADLAAKGGELNQDAHSAARSASLDLIWVAFLLEASPSGLDPHRSTK